MSKKLSELTQVTEIKDNDLIYIVSLTRPEGDRSIGANKDTLGNSLGAATGVPTVVSAIWSTGLSFFVTADALYLEDILYSATAADVTLDAADPTLDRLDYLGFYASTGLVGKATGTANTSLLIEEPDYDPSDFYPIKLVLVKAGETTPSDPTTGDPTTTTLIFDEDTGSPTEWDLSLTSNLAVTTNDPYSGTKSIEATGADRNDRMTFDWTSPLRTDDISALTWWTKLDSDLGNNFIDIRFYNSGARVGGRTLFSTGENGYDSSNLNWQKITVNRDSLTNLKSGDYDRIVIRYYTATAVNWFFDLFDLNSGSTPIPPTDTESNASTTLTNTDNFNGNLSSTDDTVQKALDTLDDLVLGSPLTTKGDLYTYDTGDQRLPVGADGQVLEADSAEATGLKWVTPSGGSSDEFIAFAFSDETTDLAVGTSAISFAAPDFAITLTGVSVNVVTAPTGSTAIFDINEGGTSILSTKISIDAGETNSETAATPPVISDSSIAANAIITVDIDQVGSTVTGAGGKVWMYYTRT